VAGGRAAEERGAARRNTFNHPFAIRLKGNVHFIPDGGQICALPRLLEPPAQVAHKRPLLGMHSKKSALRFEDNARKSSQTKIPNPKILNPKTQ
jgi:hypothetical protein